MEVADIWTKSLFPSLLDYIIMGVYLILMFMWAFQVQRRKRDSNPAYQYYTWGLLAKVSGAIALCLVYTLYYKDGGDTTGYYRSSEALVNLLFQNPAAYFQILFQGLSTETYSAFDVTTGYPWYMRDNSSFAIVRIASIFTLLGFKNYFTASILFAWFFYIGYWKLYLFMNHQYPELSRPFAWAVLFFPSVVFWGSGITKDTVALSMTGLFLYSTYQLLIVRKNRIINGISLLMATTLVLLTKAYIFVALLPGAMIWFGWNHLRKIKNPILRFISTPLTAILFVALGLGLLGLFSPSLGEYGSVEGIINKAIITYEDHSRAVQYGYNFYTLGEFDGSIANFLGKTPAAITTGLARPFLWEVRNPMMLVAALENSIFMMIALILIWRIGLIKLIRSIFDEPLVVFGLTFSLIFAFAVGISSANFGALVRLKIPLIPFLAGALFVLFHRSQELKFQE